MAGALKEKDETVRSSKTSNHVFHNTGCEMISNQAHSNPYLATGANTFHHPDFSYRYNQHLYT
jgi:hypothetical protein